MHRIFLFLIILIVFVLGFTASKQALTKIYNDLSVKEQNPSSVVVGKTGCDETCQKTINDEIAKAVASISGATKTGIVTKTVEPISKPQTSYIPLDGSFSTTSTDWIDAKGIEVSFNLAQDYAAGAKVSWEASLRVANANGVAYARLFDATHGIAVSGSEISVTNNADYQRVSSGNLNLWSGRNVYRVQLKSLNSLLIDYSGGKIRVSY